MAVWYVRDNSTVYASETADITVGSIGWSGITAWAASASIAPGTIRRQSAGNATFTASRSTTTLTVTGSPAGTIYLGMQIATTASGTNQCTVTALGTGTGGAGTYTVSVSGTVNSTTWAGGLIGGNQLAFVATQATTGTTGATEPTWSLTKGGSTTDNTVTWIECSGQPAVNGDLTNTPASSTVRSLSPGRGKIIKDNAGTHIFIQTSAAGTTGSGEPSYVTTSVGSTTTDSTVTWTYIGTSFSNWAAPLSTLTQNNTWIASGDTTYLGDDHAEISQSVVSALSPGSNSSPNFYYSIDHTLSLPVTGLKTGASVATQTNITLNVNATGSGYYYGITFNCGTGSSAASLNIGGNGSGTCWTRLDSCLLKLGTTSNSSLINIGVSTRTTLIELINTTMQFGATGQTVGLAPSSKAVWRNTASAIVAGTIPTTLFSGSNTQGVLLMEGVDLSAVTGTLVPAGTTGIMNAMYQFLDCKLGSGVTVASTPINLGGPLIDVIRSASTSASYIQRRYWYQGTLQEEATVIRTSGATDGTTGISWNLTTTANSRWVMPLESFPIAIWNGIVTPTDRTITLHGIWNSASLPNNDDIWIDVEYLGDSGSPLASVATETKASNIATGTALTADSVSAWDSVATGRAQNHAYNQGDIIKASTNVGRLFFCTVAGTSANTTIPAGYASAVDGGTVTDGGATFRAGTRFILTVGPVSPKVQLVGYLKAYVKAAKASSTFYVDPLIVLS